MKLLICNVFSDCPPMIFSFSFCFSKLKKHLIKDNDTLLSQFLSILRIRIKSVSEILVKLPVQCFSSPLSYKLPRIAFGFCFFFLKIFFNTFKFYWLIDWLIAVFGLRFCARAFSSCSKRGPLFIAVRGPLTIAASLVEEHRLQTHRLSSCGSWA